MNDEPEDFSHLPVKTQLELERIHFILLSVDHARDYALRTYGETSEHYTELNELAGLVENIFIKLAYVEPAETS